MKDPIVQIGAAVLRQVAKPVSKKDIAGSELKKLVAKMLKALNREKHGVAIAAPQVGESLRMFIIAGRAFASDADDEDEELQKYEDKVFINPEIIRVSKKTREMSEGCLSVRGKYGTVMRHEKASIKAFGLDGKPFIYHGSGLLAHIFQHECDHLDGILYIDKAVKLTNEDERDALREKHPA